MTDRVEVSGLRLVARHGLLPEERERAQPFEIDLEIEADLERAGREDDISATVDYATVVERVEGLATRASFGTIEALAAAIASEVLSFEHVTATTVRVRKLRPPVAADLSSASVVIRREA